MKSEDKANPDPASWLPPVFRAGDRKNPESFFPKKPTCGEQGLTSGLFFNEMVSIPTNHEVYFRNWRRCFIIG